MSNLEELYELSWEERDKRRLTLAETCALRLLRLCVSGYGFVGMSRFYGMEDANNDSYSAHILSLEKKGEVRIARGNIYLD